MRGRSPRSLQGLVLPLLLLMAALAGSAMDEDASIFQHRRITVPGEDGGDATFPYLLYVPPRNEGKGEAERLPVILFLHGAGERGDDGERQGAVGIGEVLRATPERVPAIVVLPQAPLDGRWIGAPAQAALAALDRTLEELHGDPDRVYLTGLSMGGYGVWHLALAEPRRFAALVPVCGGLLPQKTTSSVRLSPLLDGAEDPYAATAERLRHLPIWVFHGADDPIVPVSESRRLVEELRKVGADVRSTEYPDVGHGSWEPAYAEAGLWTWLFAQHR
jgi:predicted peptidase